MTYEDTQGEHASTNSEAAQATRENIPPIASRYAAETCANNGADEHRPGAFDEVKSTHSRIDASAAGAVRLELSSAKSKRHTLRCLITKGEESRGAAGNSTDNSSESVCDIATQTNRTDTGRIQCTGSIQKTGISLDDDPRVVARTPQSAASEGRGIVLDRHAPGSSSPFQPRSIEEDLSPQKAALSPDVTKEPRQRQANKDRVCESGRRPWTRGRNIYACSRQAGENERRKLRKVSRSGRFRGHGLHATAGRVVVVVGEGNGSNGAAYRATENVNECRASSDECSIVVWYRTILACLTASP